MSSIARFLLLCFWLLGPPCAAQTLRVGLSADVTSMDPHFAALASNVNISSHVFEPLTQVDADAQLIPALAESWRSVDPLTWEFKLRRGVRFHDGSEFGAQDVVFSLERPLRFKDRPGGFQSYVKRIAAMEIVDPHTLRIRTDRPYALLPYELVSVFIVSHRAAANAQAVDFDRGTAMVGTGAFRFSRFARGDRIELVRNDSYWGRKAHWERASFRIITSDPARVAALLSGDVDLIDNVPSSDVARIERDNRFATERKVSWRTIFYTMDQRTPPFNDSRVRLAMSKAIDRAAIADKVMEGLAVPTANVVSPAVFGHAPDVRVETYDPEGAKRLLREAGYAQGFDLRVHAPNNRYVNDEQVAQAVAQMLSRVGIRTRVETLPLNVYFSRARAQEFPFAMLGWGSFSGNLASRSLLMTHDAAKSLGAWNWGRYQSAEVDALILQSLETFDEAQRRTLVQDALRRAHGDSAILPLYHQIAVWAMAKDLRYAARTDEFTFAFDVRPRH